MLEHIVKSWTILNCEATHKTEGLLMGHANSILWFKISALLIAVYCVYYFFTKT